MATLQHVSSPWDKQTFPQVISTTYGLKLGSSQTWPFPFLSRTSLQMRCHWSESNPVERQRSCSSDCFAFISCCVFAAGRNWCFVSSPCGWDCVTSLAGRVECPRGESPWKCLFWTSGHWCWSVEFLVRGSWVKVVLSLLRAKKKRNTEDGKSENHKSFT